MNNKDLEDKCRILLGLPPHHLGTNFCAGDGYFGKSIEREFGKGPMHEMLARLQPEVDAFRNLTSIKVQGGERKLSVSDDLQDKIERDMEKIIEDIDLETGEILREDDSFNCDGMTLGQKLEIAFDIKAEIDQLEEIVKAKKADYEHVQREILSEMAEKDLDKIECLRGSATFKSEPYPNIKDHNQFFDWVATTKRFEFLEKRCSRSAVKDMLQNEGLLPPGIDTYIKESVSLRKKAVRKKK